MLDKTFEFVLFEEKDNVGYITLNNPAQMNAVTAEVTRDLITCLEYCEQSDSVRCVVEAGVSSYEVVLSLEEYWKYVEYGTRPHWPPVSAILRWVQVKPVIPRPGADGRIPTQKQLAYLIARKISRVGTEGSDDLRRTLEEVNAEYFPQLEEALAQDASEYVTRILVSNP